MRVHCTPGLGDAVKVRRGVERRERQESPEGGAAGGAGLPRAAPKETLAEDVRALEA